MYYTKTKSYLEFLLGKFFSEKFSNNNHNLYLFASKDTAWGNPDNPPPVFGSTQDTIDIWDDFLFAQKCTFGDMAPVIRNRQWQNNQIYTMYEHDIDLASIAESNSISPYYVINRHLRVYKCIYNGASPTNPTGLPSTKEPGVATQVTNVVGDPESINLLRYDDGYSWKYMYTISPNNAFKFYTRNHIPIEENIDVKNAAIDGTIEVVKIINGGTNYVDGTYNNVPIIKNGNPNLNNDIAEATIIVQNGSISTVTVTYRGAGYRRASLNHSTFPALMIGANGTGAILKPIISPIGGHGSDVIDELSCSAYMIYNIFDNIPDVPPEEDGVVYRKFGLLYNPRSTDSSLYTQQYATLNNLLKYSGKILYIEHRHPIERNSAQNEIFRLLIKL